MNTSQKLDYVAGKLGLIPAFGDSIGRDVNKAELGLCANLTRQAIAEHGTVLADAARLERTLAALVTAVREHNGQAANLGQCILHGMFEATDLLNELHARNATATSRA